MKTIHHIFLMLVAGLALSIGYGSLACAATITVTNLSDSGDGSLRQAITDAVPGDIINFGVTGIITLTSGKLYINKTLIIEGPGASILAISGNNTSQVFDIYGYDDVVFVAISDVTISDGNEIVYGGGGIRNWSGTVELTNVNVFNSQSSQSGGGILNLFGTMTITNGNISNNKSTGIVNSNGSTMNIINSTVTSNDGARGGGIWVEGGGNVSVTNSTITNNRAGLGGGIANDGTSAITNSTISGNEAYDIPTLATWGGGISNFGALTLANSTITENSAEEKGDGIFNRGTVTLMNSIIANNSIGDDCYDEFGTLISLGYNLDSDGTCNLIQPTDWPNRDPGLGPLADNGGPTETHALLVGSTAIDAGEQNCTDGSGTPLLADQRGEPRPIDGNSDGFVACDIGAYEVQPAATFIVSIDILPNEEVNSINLKSKGVIPVAILATESFDATTVDPLSVEFGSDGALEAHGKGHIEDVDGDGYPDLVLHFKTEDTGIQCGDTSASLTGETFDGQPIEGSDSIRTVGCK
jgi:hypothetical protein